MVVNGRKTEEDKAFLVFEDKDAANKGIEAIETAKALKEIAQIASRQTPGSYYLTLDVKPDGGVVFGITNKP